MAGPEAPDPGTGISHRWRVTLLIAATAHAHGATVYTRHAADLAGLEDLITIVST